MMAALAALFIGTGAPAQAQEEAPVVKDGSTVSIEYTLKLDDGSTADSNVGGEPLVYVQGQQQLLPALEAKLAGLKEAESVDVTLSADEGYGPVHPEGIQVVPLELIPEQGRHEGALLMGEGPNGEPIQARVKELQEDTAVIDLNHPLAGERLHFVVKVLRIE